MDFLGKVVLGAANVVKNVLEESDKRRSERSQIDEERREGLPADAQRTARTARHRHEGKLIGKNNRYIAEMSVEEARASREAGTPNIEEATNRANTGLRDIEKRNSADTQKRMQASYTPGLGLGAGPIIESQARQEVEFLEEQRKKLK